MAAAQQSPTYVLLSVAIYNAPALVANAQCHKLYSWQESVLVPALYPGVCCTYSDFRGRKAIWRVSLFAFTKRLWSLPEVREVPGGTRRICSYTDVRSSTCTLFSDRQTADTRQQSLSSLRSYGYFYMAPFYIFPSHREMGREPNQRMVRGLTAVDTRYVLRRTIVNRTYGVHKTLYM